MSRLKEIKWNRYSAGIGVEYEQCLSEGRAVEAYQELAKKIDAMPEGAEKEKLSKALGEVMAAAPMKEAFPFQEPSAYEEILRLRPEAKATLPAPGDEAERRDRVAGAWYGRVAGCLLGKPVECYKKAEIEQVLKNTGNFPLKGYIHRDPKDPQGEWRCWIDGISGFAPSDDDTNYTVLGLKIVEMFGRDFTPDDVGYAWLGHLPFLAVCTAEQVAYQNMVNGMLPPESAVYHNPYREYIGAQIRGDYFGYINPGAPQAAAEMAYRDACISHVKNGIYGEMLVAAMLAAAAVSQDVKTVILAGLGEIPENCRMSQVLRAALKDYENGVSAQQAFARLHEEWDEYDPLHWCHAISNALIVVLSLLYGEMDFGKSLCLSVETGFDTDCNGATVGSILGMMLGRARLPEEWLAPFNGVLETGISGYNRVNIDDMVEITLKHMA